MVVKCVLHTSGTKDKELDKYMKLAWLTKISTMGVPVRGEGASTIITDMFPKQPVGGTPTPLPQNKPTSESSQAGFLEKFIDNIKNLIPFKQVNDITKGQSFLTPEQKHWKAQVETYAESPFEKSLFYLKKRPNEFIISKAWADGIKSSDPLTREAALTLFKAYISYTDMDNSYQLSSHTQMKLMIFSPHLSEGPLGKAILYESILSLPMAQILEFSNALTKDFASLPPIAQALILKQMIDRRKVLDKNLSEEEAAKLKKLIKALVIQFYCGKHEAISQVLNQQEKIRLGFLKIQPVEEAYRQELEEIERRYRLKLRQLKKRRSQKIAEAEEEKMRRIELIYDSVEGNLIQGLGSIDLEMDEVLAV
jgi:hypothetical protein